MKSIRIHQHGGTEVLQLDDLPTPEPGAGQARVKHSAIGVNFVDIYHRKGIYKNALPLTLGQEGAGVVEAIGPGVTDVKPGDTVVYAGPQGAYAEYAIVPAWQLVPAPAALDLQLALAVLEQGLTAHYLACSTFPLGAGHTALVHAAAGGVGQLLTQIAKQRGARVIGTVSTEEKATLARSLGADEVVLYSQVDFEAEVKRLTANKGVDVVYDSVGVDTFEKSLNCLRPRGYMVLYGQSSGVVPPVDPHTLNAKGSLFLTRPTLRNYAATRDELLGRANDLFEWMLAGKLQVRVDKTFALSEAAEAHRYMEARQSKGKVLLLP